MSLTKNPRRPRKPRPVDIPADYAQYPAVPSIPASDRGATLNLQDPTAFINWLASNAEGFQHNSEQLRGQSRDLWAAAAEHDRQAQALHAQMEQVRGQLDELAKQIDELAAQRETEQQKQKMCAAEAKQFDERAQAPENAAADIHAAIPVLQQAMDNANGQAPPVIPPIEFDPKETAEIDGSIARMIDAEKTELTEKQREGKPL